MARSKPGPWLTTSLWERHRLGCPRCRRKSRPRLPRGFCKRPCVYSPARDTKPHRRANRGGRRRHEAHDLLLLEERGGALRSGSHAVSFTVFDASPGGRRQRRAKPRDYLVEVVWAHLDYFREHRDFAKFFYAVFFGPDESVIWPSSLIERDAASARPFDRGLPEIRCNRPGEAPTARGSGHRATRR